MGSEQLKELNAQNEEINIAESSNSAIANDIAKDINNINKDVADNRKLLGKWNNKK